MTHPVQVDEDGNFLSRDLSNGNYRRRRNVESAIKEPVFFHLSAFGQNFHLNVTLNAELLSPNFVVEVRGNQTSSFHFDLNHCHYTGHAVPSKGQGIKVALSNCDGLVRKTNQFVVLGLILSLFWQCLHFSHHYCHKSLEHHSSLSWCNVGSHTKSTRGFI